ncbi:hypothetical protein PCANC_07560 [Puccinia coronata f. sp. avenae]|uniref:Reverse transcriptase Ty1/copia-type domain-containing protein n=1 Tax=Puccinia coronata f. sp. avenae TaxID=200324 RepID=A0A2N5SQH7_9BASI|nr:hypothetical protein PCANC_15681 [Puccinia coronata f. sp. avenae]PLW52994.1 hypothetical protein PCANC_07560 [Puccinia coronata f. sp. avenae]
MPSKYWAKAVSTAFFLENFTPVRQLKWKTPYQLWHGGKVERCHNTVLHVADFPGVSIFAPSHPSSQFDLLATLEFAKLNKTSHPADQPPHSPNSSSQDILDWQSANNKMDLDAPLIYVRSFFLPTDDEHHSIPSPSSFPSALPAQIPSPIPSFPPAMPAQISACYYAETT